MTNVDESQVRASPSPTSGLSAGRHEATRAIAVLGFKSPSRRVDFNSMRRGTASTFQATAAESSVVAVLAVLMLVAFGAVIGALAYGTVKGALEGAGLALFLAAMLAAPVYAQKVRSRHDI